MQRNYRVYTSFGAVSVASTRVVIRDDGVLILYDDIGKGYPVEIIRRAYADGKWASIECLDHDNQGGVKNDQ